MVMLEVMEKTKDQHGCYGYGVKDEDGETVPEFFAAMNMTAGNTFFKKMASQLVTSESCPSKTQIIVW